MTRPLYLQCTHWLMPTSSSGVLTSLGHSVCVQAAVRINRSAHEIELVVKLLCQCPLAVLKPVGILLPIRYELPSCGCPTRFAGHVVVAVDADIGAVLIGRYRCCSDTVHQAFAKGQSLCFEDQCSDSH